MAERQNKLLLNIEQGTTSEEKAMGRLNLGLATVAATGNYSDLSGTPSIPAAPVQSDWTNNDPTSLAYIQHRPNLATVATTGSYNDLTDTPAPSESPEIVTVIHSQGGTTETPVAKLSIDDDFKSLSADAHDIGLLAPVPGASDHGKMVVVNNDLLDYAEVPNGLPTTAATDQYLTTNGSGTVEWTIKPICRATETSGGDTDLDICRQIQISNDYANHNETVGLVGIGGGGWSVTDVGVLPPANPTGDKILFTDSYGKVIWDNKYTAGTGITINANNQIAWQYSVGRNLHLNQNRAIQTNIPGGIWTAPTSQSNSFTALSGADFAGAYRLGCRHNISDKYELGIIYTASGLSSTITFVGTETVIGLDNSVTTNQAVYIEQSYYTPSNRFGYNTSTQFDPTVHKAIYYSGVAQIGPTSDTKIAIWQDNGTVKISFTSVEVGKVGATN